MSEELRIFPVSTTTHCITRRDIVAVLFRRLKLFLISFLFILGAGVLYTLLMPSYKAEMKVLVQHGRIDPALTPTETPPPIFEKQDVSEEELNSEVELLQDEDILRTVVLNTNLATQRSWLPWPGRGDQEQQIAHAVKRLARKLNVQPVRKSHLIAISYASPDPQMSAAVLKALADAYLAKHIEIRKATGQQSFFEQQMQQSRRALDDSEAQLMHFTRTRNVVSAPLQRDLTLQKMSDAESAELGLQTAITEAAERVRTLEVKIRDLPERRVAQISNADNPQLQEKLKSKLLELQLKRTELLTKFQPSYRLVEEVDQQIAQTKAAIAAEDLRPLRDEVTEANPQYEWADSERIKALVELQVLLKKQGVERGQIARYKQAAEKLGENVIAQGDLERRLKAAEDKFLLYSNKREEARIGDALDQNGILNVTLAQEPRVPALPAWPLWAATCLSFAAALVLSTGATFAADYFDPSFRTPDEVVAVLGAPVLASLPARASPRLVEHI